MKGLKLANDWRQHHQLKGRFLPDHPDDLQVIVHDGGPRISSHSPEVVWVTVTGVNGDVFKARILNKPNNLHSVQQSTEIKFLVAAGADFPVMATEKYLRERGAWIIHACQKCGFSELFDAPSDLIRVVFPDAPANARLSMFTSFCPLCGGVQGVESKDNRTEWADKADSAPKVVKRPWWRFW